MKQETKQSTFADESKPADKKDQPANESKPAKRHEFQDFKIDGYSFAAPEDELGYTTHFKMLSDGTIAEIDNYSNKIVRKQPSAFEAACSPSILPVPFLHAHHSQMPYDEHLAKVIVSAITEGHTLSAISKQKNMPSAGTIGRWRVENPEFDDAIIKARKIRAETYHDRIADSIAEDESLDWKEVPRAKMSFEKLKWLAAVNDPKTFAASKSEKSAISAGQVIIDTGIRDKE